MLFNTNSNTPTTIIGDFRASIGPHGCDPALRIIKPSKQHSPGPRKRPWLATLTCVSQAPAHWLENYLSFIPDFSHPAAAQIRQRRLKALWPAASAQFVSAPRATTTAGRLMVSLRAGAIGCSKLAAGLEPTDNFINDDEQQWREWSAADSAALWL